MLDIKQISQAIQFMAKEKNVEPEKIVEIIESAIKTAYKKDYGSKDEEVNVKLDLEEESLEVTVEKTIVKEVTNPAVEISFAELGEDAEGFEEGDVIEIDVTDEVQSGELGDSFGRIASQAARQVIIQKIGDTEKEKIYEMFKGKKGSIINVKVDIVEGNKVFFEYNGTKLILPKSEQVSTDNYVAGSRFYLYVDEVVFEDTAPKIVFSRKRPELVTAIFAESIPEIEEGSISIDNVVRHAGVKTKILVSSQYDEIDPVGTLIGQKGIRVKAVMDELGGEKIDIIPNGGNDAEMIKRSLSPANVLKVDVDDESRVANAYILPSERARAVGRNGLNVNLASKLTDYTINILDVEVEEESE